LQFAFGRVDEPVFREIVAEHAAKRRSDEAVEGLASFAEKRPARW
jgi:methylglutaconyl-CoA hydratase